MECRRDLFGGAQDCNGRSMTPKVASVGKPPLIDRRPSSDPVRSSSKLSLRNVVGLKFRNLTDMHAFATL